MQVLSVSPLEISLTFFIIIFVYVAQCKILKFAGNKTKGRISRRRLKENKARQIFRKTKIS